MKLCVTVPLDDKYDELIEYLKYKSYQKTFWHSFAPPHKIEFSFENLSQKGIDSMKNFFRELYKDSQNKIYCTFKEYEETKI